MLLVAFFLCLSASAETHPIQRLIEAARTGSPELKSLLAQGLPGLDGRDGAVVWHQDFLFAVQSAAAATVSIDKQPPEPMQRVPGTNLHYLLRTLRLGTTHQYVYQSAGRTIGAYEVAGYNPGSYPQPGVPQGRLSPERRHTSRIYPGMTASYWIYANAGVDPSRPAPLMVWQDGQTITGNADLLRLRLAIVTDNLVHQRRMPPMVHVLIAPGSGGEATGTRMRSIQYDTVSPRYGQYLLEEILPLVQAEYKLRSDPYSRAIAGASSGAICAFTAAWHYPQLFSRVLSHIGSYTALQWDPARHLEGGYILNHHVRRQPQKNLRVWLSDGTDDIENFAGSWPLANIALANALKLKNYDFHFRFGSGMHAIAQGALDLPESLTWLWRDYDPSKTSQTYEMEPAEKAKPLFRVGIVNRDPW